MTDTKQSALLVIGCQSDNKPALALLCNINSSVISYQNYYIHFHAPLCTLFLPLGAFLLGIASCIHISVSKHPLTHCHIAFMSSNKQPLPHCDNGK